VVVGSYLTDTVDRTQCLHIVVGAADKAVLAVAVSSKLHTSKGKKWLLIQVIKRLITLRSRIRLFLALRFNLVHSQTGV